MPVIKSVWALRASAACRAISESSTYTILSLIIGLLLVHQLLSRHVLNFLGCSVLRSSTILLIPAIEELTVILLRLSLSALCRGCGLGLH